MLRCWIDTDVGHNPDDAVALLVAAAHPGLEVAGVSVTGGDAAVAGALLPGVEIVAGDDLTAADLADTAALVALGPLTSVARVGAPVRTVVMGGCLAPVEHRGRVVRVDHNFAADPAAAARVVAAVDDLTLVPLGTTVRARAGDEARAVLAAAHPVLTEALAAWDAPLVLHDPVAVLVLAGEPVAPIEARKLRVGDDGALVEDPAGRRCAVAGALDVDAAIGRVVALLSR